MGVWKQVGNAMSGIVKQTFKQITREPLELGQSVVGQVVGQDNQGMRATEAGMSVANPMGQTPNDFASAGFKTKDDFGRYSDLTKQKDDIELRQLRASLHNQFAITTSLDQGMQKARMEWEQNEEQRKKVEEKKEEQKKDFEFQKKKSEDAQVTAAKGQSSAESKAWGAG